MKEWSGWAGRMGGLLNEYDGESVIVVDVSDRDDGQGGIGT
jgi:hypothetical protein